MFRCWSSVRPRTRTNRFGYALAFFFRNVRAQILLPTPVLNARHQIFALPLLLRLVILHTQYCERVSDQEGRLFYWGAAHPCMQSVCPSSYAGFKRLISSSLRCCGMGKYDPIVTAMFSCPIFMPHALNSSTVPQRSLAILINVVRKA